MKNVLEPRPARTLAPPVMALGLALGGVLVLSGASSPDGWLAGRLAGVLSKERREMKSPDKTTLVPATEALPGRAESMRVPERHFVNGQRLQPPYPEGFEQAAFGMGCFWGAERRFWQQDGVHVTAAGYAGGFTPNPTYREICTGRTGHAEVVLVVFDPARVSHDDLLRVFWESHDPTQGMRPGNDVGTQYRSVIHAHGPEQLAAAHRSRDAYQEALTAAGKGVITTEIVAAPPFYFAEPEHQQYLGKNPNGYCGLSGTGVSCPAGTGVRR